MGINLFTLALWISVVSVVNSLTCDTKQYIYENNCWDCDSKCDKSQSGGSNDYCTYNKFDCVRCLNSFVQMSDDNSCTDITEKYGYFSDLVNHKLTRCNESLNCMNCKDASTICTDCFPGYLYSSLHDSCTTTCLENYYPVDQKTCQRCSDKVSNCLTCLSERSCLTCKVEYDLLLSPITGEFSCVKPAAYPSYYEIPFENRMKILEKCDSECQTCSGQPYMCQSCAPSFLASSQDSTFYCIQSCSDGYYYSTTAQNCVQCSEGCLLCDDVGSCLLCSSDKYLVFSSLQPAVCVSNCPDGYFADEVSLACVKCHSNCRTCFGPTRFGCIDCSSSNLVKVGQYTCISSTCGDGLIALGIEECDDGNKNNYDGCSSTCKVEHGWACSPSSYVLSNNFISKCKTVCGDGVRVQPKQGGVEACDTKGQPGCDGISCQVLDGYSCSRTDDSSPDQCTYLCDSNCISCKTNYGTTTTGVCIKCKDGYFGLDNSCYSNCPNGFFNDTTSGFCTLACSTDTFISDNNCEGYTQLENKCILNCPDGSYLTTTTDTDTNTKSNICKQCHFSCGNCIGSSSKQCLTCNTGFILTRFAGKTQIQCVLECKNGFKYNQSKNECEVCVENCDTCTNGLFQLQDDCVDSCPEGTTSNTSSMKCIIFDNPQVAFEFSPKIKDNIIGINSDLTITAKISSIYPITSLLWSVENQSPSFLNGLTLTTDTLTLSKSLLEYNMKITLKLAVTSPKGYASPLLTLSTYTKPSIITKLYVNGSPYKILNHFSDILTITTDNWPILTSLSYNIYCVGLASGKNLQVASGISSKNISVKYIFPYLELEEVFLIEIELSNQELQLTVSDTVRVQIPTQSAQTIDKIFGADFDSKKLNFPQMDMICQSLDAKYQTQISQDQSLSNKMVKLLEYQNKLSIPLECSTSLCGVNGSCELTSSTPQSFNCNCSNGYSGRFCTITSEEKNQIDSFGKAISNSLLSISKSETGSDEFLKVASNVSINLECGAEVLKTVSSQISSYSDLVSKEKLQSQYSLYVGLVGKLMDNVLLQADKSSSDIGSIKQNAMKALDSLNFKRIESLNQDTPSASSSYGNNLKTYLLAQNSSDYSNSESLNFHSNWVSDTLRRNLEEVSVSGNSYNVTGLLQTKTIESEIMIPTSVIQASGLDKIKVSLNRWRFNPIYSDSNSMLLSDFESDFIELNSNIPDSAIKQSNSKITFKIPRSRTAVIVSDLNEVDNDSSESVSGDYRCVNFNQSSSRWVDSDCSVTEESQYHISCSCNSINTTIFIKREFEIFFLPEDKSKNFAEKIASNSGLWMCVAIVFIFGFCWLGVKDSNSVGEINKRAFRRTTPLLTIFFMNYPMRPVRFRILQFICAILTPFLFESILYLVSGSDPSTDSIPGYAIVALIVATPISYAIGRLANWAQYSSSEEKLFVDLIYERSTSEGIQLVKYHIVNSEKEADIIRKEPEPSKKDQSITINQYSKSFHSIQKEQVSQISSNRPQIDEIDVVSQIQPKQTKHLFMMPDFIPKRVLIFQAVTVFIAVLDVILTILLVGSLPSNQGVQYFVGSAIFGIILDIFILDIVVSFAAQYQKLFFKFVKLRDKSSQYSKAQSHNRESESQFVFSEKVSQKVDSQIENKKRKSKHEFNVYLDNEAEEMNSRQRMPDVYSESEQKHEHHQNQNI